jgi:hypothetical protein
MTGDDFNTVAVFLTTEIQAAYSKHFPIGVSTAQADAAVSAMAMSVGMFVAQDPVMRSVFNRVLDHAVELIGKSDRFQEATTKIRQGDTPKRNLGIEKPDLWPIVAAARAEASAGCLHCAIRKAIIDRFDTPVTEPDDVRAIFGNLAKVVAELICDVGEEALVFFDASLVAHLESVASKRSTKGMTKQ